MEQRLLTVTRSVTIEKPPALVRSQFADVADHERADVHRGVRFTVLDESEGACEYEQVTRQGPGRIRQRYRLDRTDAAHQVNTVVAGPFRDGTLTFDVAAAPADSSVVTATLALPTNGPTRLVAPLLRRALGRSLGRGLAEDKVDLESGAYERRGEPPPPRSSPGGG